MLAERRAIEAVGQRARTRPTWLRGACKHAGLQENPAAPPALRAAQGGYRYIACYWGVLESAQLDQEGKAVSWVPIVGAFVPDQKQQMRIRLKVLLLDVASGGWKMFTPEAHRDEGYNSRWTRESADQQLVEDLKQKGYRSLVADLLKE